MIVVLQGLNLTSPSTSDRSHETFVFLYLPVLNECILDAVRWIHRGCGHTRVGPEDEVWV